MIKKTKLKQIKALKQWSLLPVSDIFTFVKSYAFSRENLINDTPNNAGIGNIHYGDIHSKFASPSIDLKRISVPMIKDERFVPKSEDFLKDGDLIMADASEDYEGVGVTVSVHGLGNKKIVGGLHTFVLRDNKENTSKYFRQYIFRNPKIRNSLQKVANGVSVYGISKKAVSKLLLPIPPLPEQNRIVAVLETWDKAIKKLTRKIEIKKEIKKGLMRELLTGKTRLSGFTDKWEGIAFGDITAPRKERFDPKNDKGLKFCIELEHIQGITGRLLGNTNVSEDSSTKTMFYQGDILFGKLRAYLRKYWLANRSGVCSTEIWVFNADRKKVVPEILFQVVQLEKFISFATMSQGTHMPRSNWDVVSSYEVRLPSINEQISIAEIFTAAHKEIDKLEQKLSFLKDQKKYLLNNLITGTIRTPETLSAHR